jgi:hypothetical protein
MSAQDLYGKGKAVSYQVTLNCKRRGYPSLLLAVYCLHEQEY